MSLDVLVIGAGQAGLAAAYWLTRFGLSVRVVDASDRVGDSWRRRYRSLTLFTPREFSSLPGLALSGDPRGYASGGEFADYLERYADRFVLPVVSGVRVSGLRKHDDGFLAELSSGAQMRAPRVVIATGGFQVPTVPAFAGGLTEEVCQFTTESYRQPLDVVDGDAVLVVGDGASGRDIAADLAGNRKVTLACGRPRRLLPEKILGMSTWGWLKALGLLTADANSPIGRLMRKADPFPNRQRDLADLRRLGVEIRPRAVSARGRSVALSDGTSVDVGTVIWALGYRDDSSWLDIPAAVDVDRSFLHHEGRSPVGGIFFVGRPWQRNRASALIMGAGQDAERIGRAVSASRGHHVRPRIAKSSGLG